MWDKWKRALDRIKDFNAIITICTTFGVPLGSAWLLAYFNVVSEYINHEELFCLTIIAILLILFKIQHGKIKELSKLMRDLDAQVQRYKSCEKPFLYYAKQNARADATLFDLLFLSILHAIQSNGDALRHLGHGRRAIIAAISSSRKAIRQNIQDMVNSTCRIMSAFTGD